MSDDGVWIALPTCNLSRARTTADAWKAQGYRVAAITEQMPCFGASLHVWREGYVGYWRSCNVLARAIAAIENHSSREVIVFAADDLRPDPDRKANEIRNEFLSRFPDGFGVMQPTGDDLDGTDRICGSPWVGYEFMRRVYGGRGPYCEDYFHFYGDEHLLEVARRLGCLWQRPDLTQRHLHWTRKGEERRLDYQAANSARYWDADKKAYEENKKKGFVEECSPLLQLRHC